jgi:hypothetical protein
MRLVGKVTDPLPSLPRLPSCPPRSSLVFTYSTERFQPITTTVPQFLGSAAIASFEGLAALQGTAASARGTARICTISAAEQSFCNQVVALMNQFAAVTFSCVQDTSIADCAADIAAGRADMRMFGAADAYAAFKTHNLQVSRCTWNRPMLAPDITAGFVISLIRTTLCTSVIAPSTCHAWRPSHGFGCSDRHVDACCVPAGVGC